jgi:hypothetical protein
MSSPTGPAGFVAVVAATVIVTGTSCRPSLQNLDQVVGLIAEAVMSAA